MVIRFLEKMVPISSFIKSVLRKFGINIFGSVSIFTEKNQTDYTGGRTSTQAAHSRSLFRHLEARSLDCGCTQAIATGLAAAAGVMERRRGAAVLLLLLAVVA